MIKLIEKAEELHNAKSFESQTTALAELKAVINTFDAPDGRKCDHKDFIGRISVMHATGFSLDHDITEGVARKLGQNYLGKCE